MKRFEARNAYFVCMVIVGLFVSILPGCGGGGGGHWNEPVTTSSVIVTSSVPVNGVTGVFIDAKINATFSGAMDPASINAATFTVQTSGPPLGPVVAGTVNYDATTRTATFTPPASNLVPNTTYTATITTGAKDQAGNALARNFVWSFTTGAVAAPPTVTNTVPANGAAGVLINAKITATFSGAMNPASITATTFTVQASGPPLGPVVAGTVSYNAATRTATFTPPASNLAINTTYTATITTGATNLAGNALASNFVWSFTTGAVADTTKPTVISTDPVNGAASVLTNKNITATFSKDMDPATIDGTTFTVQTSGPPLGPTVVGTVSYNALTRTATFTPPASNLAPNTTYTATITTGATDLANNTLAGNQAPLPAASNYVWTFTTGGALVHLGPDTVNLVSAGTFRVLAGSAITNIDIVSNRTSINGDVGVSPGSTVNGLTELVNIVPPFHLFAGVPIAATAKVDLLAAYNDAQSRSTAAISLPGQLGGLTLAPGLYVNSTSSGISGTGPNAILTLDGQGDPNAVWIFKMGSTLITDPGTSIVCNNGCNAENIFWQVGSSAILGTNSIFYGTILADASITMNTGATLHGRALTRSGAVTLDTNLIVP